MDSFVCVFLQQYLEWNNLLIDYMENYRALPAALNFPMCQTQDVCSLNCPDGIFFFPLASSEKGFHCSVPGGASSSYLQQSASTALAVSKGKYNTGVAQHHLGVTDFPSSLPFSQARTAQSCSLSCLAFSRRGNCFGMQVTTRLEQGCAS